MEKYSRNLFFLLHFFHFSVALSELGEGSGAVSLIENSPEFGSLSVDWSLFFISFAYIQPASQIPSGSI